MRISDWSSDVCSSDLRSRRLAAPGGCRRGLALGRIERRGEIVGGRERPRRLLPARPGDGRFEPLEPGAPAGLAASGVALETPVERLDEGGADPAGDLTGNLPLVTHEPSPMPGKAGTCRPA